MSSPREINGIEIPRDKLEAYCKRNHIKRLALYGSLLRSDFDPKKSDIDLLVEFDKTHIPGFFDIARMEEELSAIFKGKKVDLRTPNDLSRYFRSKVVSSAEVLYAGS